MMFLSFMKRSLLKKRTEAIILSITFSDKTGKIKGVVWDNVDKISSGINAGDFVHVKGNISEYKGTLQAVVKNMETISRLIRLIRPISFRQQGAISIPCLNNCPSFQIQLKRKN